MFCTECGEAEQNGNFCRKCGSKLRSVEQLSATKASTLKNSVSGDELISGPSKSDVPGLPILPIKMGFTGAVTTCFRKYAVFKGRATRTEYWFWQLFWLMILAGSYLLSSVTQSSIGGTLFAIFMLCAYLPSLAVLVRRLHDTGKSGWWVLLSAIPILGSLIVLIFTLQYSEDFDNEYGPITS